MNRSARGAVLAALLVTACTAAAGQGTEEAVLRVDDQRIQAMIAGDLATLDRLLANELTYVHSNGEVQTKAEFLDRLKSGGLKYRAVRRKDARVQVIGGAAVVTGQAALEVSSNGADLSFLVRFTEVYADRGRGWELVAWQSTRIP